MYTAAICFEAQGYFNICASLFYNNEVYLMVLHALERACME